MKVFVTGASGWIGRATVTELVNNGHSVLGLARSDASAETISRLGGEVHRGDLEDVESLKGGVRAADAVIHLAFIHDFTDFARAVTVDRGAIDAMMGEVLTGTKTGKAFVVASGTLGLPKGVLATEDTDPEREGAFKGRSESADAVIAMSSLSSSKEEKNMNIRGMVVRLPNTCHGGDGDQAFMARLIMVAAEKGFVPYLGDGSNRWPAVHRLDAALLFRLAVEKGRPGATYHAVAEEGVSMRDITAVIAKKVGVPARSMTTTEAQEALGFLAFVIGVDNPVSSEKTRNELGWKPTRIGLLQDLEEHYSYHDVKSKYLG